jgi:hypothetical protein
MQNSDLHPIPPPPSRPQLASSPTAPVEGKRSPRVLGLGRSTSGRYELRVRGLRLVNLFNRSTILSPGNRRLLEMRQKQFDQQACGKMHLEMPTLRLAARARCVGLSGLVYDMHGLLRGNDQAQAQDNLQIRRLKSRIACFLAARAICIPQLGCEPGRQNASGWTSQGIDHTTVLGATRHSTPYGASPVHSVG